MSEYNKKDIPKPLLKWVGGKTQIITEILDLLPKEINNYYELFIGGGSVLLMVLWAHYQKIINIKNKINVYDLNESLIETYNNIKYFKEELYLEIIKIIGEYNECIKDGSVNRNPESLEEAKTSKESYYYWIRKLYNKEKDKTSLKYSAYFIFLNKIGFRGMYREGPNGFNIPYGNYKNPKIIDKEELDLVSELIHNVNFIHSDFSKAFINIEDQDNLIYLDPPYAPENSKSFVGYTKDGFDINQHKKLFELTKNISKNNMIMMSNSNVELVTDSFSKDEFNYKILSCRRAINSKDPSAKTEEVIITNY